MYTTHHPCWDAKNRFGLPEEVPFEYASIAGCVEHGTPPAPTSPAPRPVMVEDEPAAPKPQPRPQKKSLVPDAPTYMDLQEIGIPAQLAKLMAANNVEPRELQAVVGERGYYPADMPIRDYPADFVSGCLIAAWDQVLEIICKKRDVPF